MKESISGTALFMIVIFFVVVFTGYLCFSINQSRAFSVKNSIVRIVERYGNRAKDVDSLANEEKFRNEIREELTRVGYTTTGKCDDGWTAFNVEGSKVGVGSVGAFCLLYVGSTAGNTHNHNPISRLHYFRVKTFYHFNLEIFRHALRMTVEGSTKTMQ